MDENDIALIIARSGASYDVTFSMKYKMDSHASETCSKLLQGVDLDLENLSRETRVHWGSGSSLANEDFGLQNALFTGGMNLGIRDEQGKFLTGGYASLYPSGSRERMTLYRCFKKVPPVLKVQP